MEDNPSSGSSSGVSLYVPPGIRVMVVDDDHTSLKIVDKALSSYFYKVTTCQSAIVALDMLRKKRKEFDIVISDVHMPEMDGFMLLQRINLEMDIPVILLSVDADPSVALRGLKQGACYFFTKPVSADDLTRIWQYVIQRRRVINVKEIEQTGSVDNGVQEEDKEEKRIENALEEIECASSDNEGELESKRKKARRESSESSSSEGYSEEPAPRKLRVVWDTDLHGKFLKAVSDIGIDKAVPKRILEIMNAPGLTRFNIASHLQKYRMYLRALKDQNGQPPPCPEQLRSDLTGFNRTLPSHTPTYMYQQHNAASLPFCYINGASSSSKYGSWSGNQYKNNQNLYYGAGTSSFHGRSSPVTQRFVGNPVSARQVMPPMQSNVQMSWSAPRVITPSIPTLIQQSQATVDQFTMDSNESFMSLLNDYPQNKIEELGTERPSIPSYSCTTNLTLHPSGDGGFLGLSSSGSLNKPIMDHRADTELNFPSGWVPGSLIMKNQTNAPPFPDFASPNLPNGHQMGLVGKMPDSNQLLPENYLQLIQRTHGGLHNTGEEGLPNSTAIGTNHIPSEFTDADLEELIYKRSDAQAFELDHDTRFARKRSASESFLLPKGP